MASHHIVSEQRVHGIEGIFYVLFKSTMHSLSLQIIAATIITHFCDLPAKYNVDVVGEIPSG